MRKYLLIALACPLFAGAQTLISTTPENRTALIEQFTGIYAGEGSQGNDAANSVFTNDALRVTWVNYHAGAFSIPINNDPDLSTADGNTIANHFSVQQHPRGVINRRPFPNQYAIPMTSYQGAANAAKNLPSPVNLGMASTFDAGSRDLTVDVEILYTANSPGANDYMTILLMESGIIAYQEDFFNGPDSSYSHPNVFRTMLAGTWGDEVMITTAGHTEVRSYTINVDTAWNIANCHAVAFIGEYQDDVYQARFVPADGGTTTIGIEENSFDRVLGYAFPVPAVEQITIPFYDLTNDVSLRVTDAMGRIVATENVNTGTQQLQITTTDWKAGVYSYQIIGVNGNSSIARLFQIL